MKLYISIAFPEYFLLFSWVMQQAEWYSKKYLNKQGVLISHWFLKNAIWKTWNWLNYLFYLICISIQNICKHTSPFLKPVTTNRTLNVMFYNYTTEIQLFFYFTSLVAWLYIYTIILYYIFFLDFLRWK